MSVEEDHQRRNLFPHSAKLPFQQNKCTAKYITSAETAREAQGISDDFDSLSCACNPRAVQVQLHSCSARRARLRFAAACSIAWLASDDGDAVITGNKNCLVRQRISTNVQLHHQHYYASLLPVVRWPRPGDQAIVAHIAHVDMYMYMYFAFGFCPHGLSTQRQLRRTASRKGEKA